MQYFTGLPILLVAFHLLGAALLSAALTWLLVNLRSPAAPLSPAPSTSAPSTAPSRL